MVNEKRGSYACTDVRLQTLGIERALIEAIPLTGRTHQIRAHLAAVGLPISGDPLYGNLKSGAAPCRMALHACSLGFNHLATREKPSFTLADPEDFEDILHSRYVVG